MRSIAILCASAMLASCQPADDVATAEQDKPEATAISIPEGLKPGSNEMLRTMLERVDGVEVIVSDVIIPADSTVPRHYHPGEEVVYVIEGSAVHVEEGKPDRQITAGEAMVIPPEAIHAPRGGPDGARAIVFRVHKPGMPERIPAPE